jgi:hypothetical protein
MKTNNPLSYEQIHMLATIINESMDDDIVDSVALDMLQELLDDIAGCECLDVETIECIHTSVLSQLHNLKGE